MKSTDTAFIPLSQRPDFVPCRVGDVLTPEQEAALLPGLDAVLREVAAAFAEATLSQHSTAPVPRAEVEAARR